MGRVKGVLDFDRGTLALFDGDTQSYRLQTLFEAREDVPPVVEMAVPLDQGIAGAVMRSQQVRLVTGLDAARNEIPLPADPSLWDGSLSTILSLPLQAHGDVLGALTLGTVRPHGYRDDDVQFPASAATYLALAIDHGRQNERLRRANQEVVRLGSFPELNRAAIIELDLAKVLQADDGGRGFSKLRQTL